ncbi:MAG: MFS transporter [Ilumatobacteraceae bacterium]
MSPEVRRARNALWAAFVVMGIGSMAWTPRIPEIKDALGLSSSGLGIVLFLHSLGALLGAHQSGRVIHRLGTRRTAAIAGLGLMVPTAFLGHAPTVPTLVALLATASCSYAVLDVAVNTQALAIERLSGRRYLSSFHGCWSIGALLVSLLGAVVARATTPGTNLLVVGVAGTALHLAIVRRLLAPEHDAAPARPAAADATHLPLFARGTRSLWLLGAGLVTCLIPEASVGNWGALLLTEALDAPPGTNASVLVAFAVAMVAGRLVGDRMLERGGAERVVRACGLGGAAGLAAGLVVALALAPARPGAALVAINAGFALAGFAIGPMIPAFIAAAGAQPGISPAAGIARLNFIGLSGFFIGPITIGVLADATSLATAWAFPAVTLAISGLLAPTVRSRRAPSPAPTR